MLFPALVIPLWLAAAALVQAPPPDTPTVDVTQAESMLALLDQAAHGRVDTATIDAVMQAPGTDLVIGQMNLVRKVTRAQYRELLTALAAGREPALEPADDSERARRGVEGLRRDVWPALAWGVAHTAELRAATEALRRAPVRARAMERALSMLPVRVEVSPTLFVVMGGRAGAAALAGDRLYVDVLTTDYRASLQGDPPLDEAGAEAFFAHETHHIALARSLAPWRASLDPTPADEHAIGFLHGLVAEGSATYLIDWNRNVAAGRDDPRFAAALADPDVALATAERLARRLVVDGVERDEDFDRLTSVMLGNAYHVTGAIMFAAIDRAGGLDAVMGVLSDPRSLLAAYNAAVSETPAAYRFDPALARRAAALGARRPRTPRRSSPSRPCGP